MGRNTSREKRRTALMALPIGDLVTWRLVLTCAACGDARDLALALLVRRYGARHTLQILMPRFRCRFRNCRRQPSTVRLVTDAGGAGYQEITLRGPGAY